MILDIFNRNKNKQIEVKLENADDIADLLADKLNAKNDEVMLLTQENEKLGYELNKLGEELRMAESENKTWKIFSEKQAENLQEQIRRNKGLAKELSRSDKRYAEMKKQLKELAESGERQVDTIQDYAEQIIEMEEELKKKSSKENNKRINELIKINGNQINYIEILQVIASAKADKMQLKDVFSHNMCEYLVNNFNTMKQAEEKLGINRTTLSELKSGKTALSYDNLDILDSKMCEYFECSVYDLVTKKMEGKKND